MFVAAAVAVVVHLCSLLAVWETTLYLLGFLSRTLVADGLWLYWSAGRAADIR